MAKAWLGDSIDSLWNSELVGNRLLGVRMASRAHAASIMAANTDFIVWLAHQHLSISERSRICPNAVECFLRWQRDQREHGHAHTENAYYDELRESVTPTDQIDTTRATISLFRRYLRTS